GEWPLTSALGLLTRKYSALRSNVSPLSKAMVSALRSLCNRNSVGQGVDAASLISISSFGADRRESRSGRRRAIARAEVEAKMGSAQTAEHLRRNVGDPVSKCRSRGNPNALPNAFSLT